MTSYQDLIISPTAKWSDDITYSFGTSAFNTSGLNWGVLIGDVSLNSDQKSAAENALRAWQDVADITITYSGLGNQGDITYYAHGFALNLLWILGEDNAGAVTNTPDSLLNRGDVWINNDYLFNGTRSIEHPAAGNWGWYAFLHETGHALGLNLDPNHDGAEDAETVGTVQTTVMSYQPHTGYVSGGFGTLWPITPMVLDIQAIQSLYGANFSTRNTDTTYLFTGTQEPIQAIWDGGGTDTIDASLATATQGVIIDLNPGAYSSIGGTNNIGIAFLYQGDIRSYIENAIGGAGDDTITGNATANVLTGNGGKDRLSGGPGDDILNGGDGTDTAVFQLALGNQTPGHPGKFDGYYTLTRHGITVTVTAKPGTPSAEGTDTLSNVELLKFSDQTINILDLLDLSGQTTTGGRPTDGGNATSGSTVSGHEASTGGSATGETRTGNDTSEYLSGTSGPDVLRGMGGDDVLTGYGGQDTFDGGLGSDTVDYSYQPASVSGIVNLGAGMAVFPGFYTETLTSIENVWMGAGNDNVAGDGGPNDLRGGPGDDTLNGGLGNDVIYGDWKYSDKGGVDTAIVSYTYGSGYTVSGSADALHMVGMEGDDWYYNVEKFQFAGGVTKTTASVLQSSSATPASASTEIVVNTSTASSQDHSSVATFENGRFVVVWTDNSGNIAPYTAGTEIRGQAFEAGGTKVGPEFSINTVTDGSQFSPTVATLSNNSYVVTWIDGSQINEGFWSLRAQLFNEAGNKIGQEFLINTMTRGATADIAALSDENFVIVWGSHGQLFNSDGDKLGGEFSLDSNPTVEAGNPQVVSLLGGRFFVTWENWQNGEIYGRIFDNDGTAIGSEFTVNGITAGFQWDPSVTALTDGRFVVTWTDTQNPGVSYSLQGQLFEADGSRSGNQFTLNSTSRDSPDFHPKIVPLPDGRFVALYENTNGSIQQIVQVFAADGTPSGNPVVVSAAAEFGNVNEADIAVFRDGSFVVCWTDGGFNASDVHAQIFSPYAVNQVPIARADTVTAAEDSPISGNVLTNNGSGADNDPDGDSLTVVAVNGTTASINHSLMLASGALLIVNADGRFVYDPNGKFDNLNVGQTASDSFIYTISDGQGHTSTATVSLTIAGTVHGLQITGGSGNLNGTSTDDQIAGGPGNEIIHGGAGYDWLQGGAGNDTLFGDAGSDALTGGPGDDRFVFAPGGGADIFTDFVAGAQSDDKIDLKAFAGFKLTDVLNRTTQIGADTVIDFGNGDTITLQNIDRASLNSDDFLVPSNKTQTDFNADAKSDLLFVNNTSHGLAQWQLDGTQVASAAQFGTVNAAAGWHYSARADFNGDGRTDLFFLNDGTHGAAIWQMDGMQVASAAQVGTINAAAGWHYSDHADFDGDGKSDLLFLNDTNHGVAIWQMNGTQVASAAQVGTINAAGGWAFSSVGDFDGDGKSDLLFLNDTTHGVAVWQMNGTQVASAAQVGTMDAGFHFADTGDFNGDGKTDLLLLNETTHGVAIWQMNGTQATSAIQFGTINAADGWHFAEAADFSGDGKTDLLFLNDTTHGVAIWQMNGTQITAAAQVGTINAAGGWSYSGAGDFNGDGKTDLLFESSTSHGIAVWEMNGTQILAAAQIGTVNAAADWHLIT